MLSQKLLILVAFKLRRSNESVGYIYFCNQALMLLHKLEVFLFLFPAVAFKSAFILKLCQAKRRPHRNAASGVLKRPERALLQFCLSSPHGAHNKLKEFFLYLLHDMV